MARKTSKSKRVEPRFEADSADVNAHSNERVGAPGEPRAAQKPRTGKKKAKPSKPSLFRRLVLRPLPRLLYWGVVLGLWLMIGVAGVIGYYATQLPSADTWAVPQRPPNMRILAADDTLIGNRGVTGGTALRLEDMSPYIPQAVIAIEDRRFHAHFGFDPIGFARAMVRNVAYNKREGGSTLTQQLAKNLFLKPDRTLGRKVQELILAFWLETRFSKADILELYLNRVYFGSGATGVDAASRRYFGKSAKDVTISEAALLAGLLKAPSRYSPARSPKLSQARARVVLKAMQREGYITADDMTFKSIRPGEHARHFRSGPEHYVADMVAKEARSILGEARADVVVETTIDPYLMLAAQTILDQSLTKHGRKKQVSQAALVALAPDGAIRALIGGRNYAKSQFNRVVDAKRQPGSAFKTFVWLSALERGQRPNSVVEDRKVRYGKWSPENYDRKYRGPVTLNQAFAQSLNTVAAQLTMEAGPRTVANTARRLGISSDLTANASLALGTSEVSLMELTAAYAPFSNGGLSVTPHLISKITSAKGKILYQRKPQTAVRVVNPEQLGMMNAMLTHVLDAGTGTAAKLVGHPAGGKTGTSQNSRDALFVGHTAHLVTGVWFGNDNNSPTRKLTGGSLPAKAWHEFMTTAHANLQPLPLPGEPAFLASLPVTAPMPSFRPQTDPIETASVGLRERVKAMRQKAGKTILDLITRN